VLRRCAPGLASCRCLRCHLCLPLPWPLPPRGACSARAASCAARSAAGRASRCAPPLRHWWPVSVVVVSDAKASSSPFARGESQSD
jgi:hypothetical protein